MFSEANGGIRAISLNAQTSTGTGTQVPFYTTIQNVACQISYTGFTAVIATLQGTIDGTNYFTVGTWDNSIQSTGDIVVSSNVPLYGARLNATTLTGTGTVTGWISGG